MGFLFSAVFIFTHGIKIESVIALQYYVWYLPMIQWILFPVGPPPEHMFSFWSWRAEQYDEGVKVSRKGIYVIYGLVRDESDRAAVFS